MTSLATKLRALGQKHIGGRVIWFGLGWEESDLTDDEFEFLLGSAQGMGLGREFLNGTTADAEVLSEAIEAAEALGL